MQPTTMLPKLTDTTQTITFSDSDEESIRTGEVYASNVIVTTNAGTHSHGSSAVQLKSLVDYNWEPRAYPGQLLAVHLSGNYLAYCIKAPNAMSVGCWCGMVRVVYTEGGTDRRALIKGMKGEVMDLAFAHIQSQVVLACIDEQGNFYVHEIELTDSVLRCTLIAEIRAEPGLGSDALRVVWCPYIPEDEECDDDVARLLLTTHGNIARIWNMQTVAKLVAATECVAEASDLLDIDGVLTAREHTAPVVDAAFSPDGTALATAAADGHVMFFQVYMNNSEGSPRCLHKWQPHGGLPLSCLFFLDNHRQCNSDVQFWKFAVTGAENNTVIKIWSCKSWSCLQTITFTGGSEPGTLGMKAMLDHTASYLILSDFKARSLYVLNMARDKGDTTAYCKSVSEFQLPYPVLSFCIIDADEEVCESGCGDPFHKNGVGDDDRQSPDDFDREDEAACKPEVPARRVRIRLYIVQPKGLQQGELIYSPPPTAPTTILDHDLSELTIQDISTEPVPSNILQQQSQQLKSLLLRQTQPGSLLQRPESPHHQINLMTPDAFSSPGKREEDDPPLSATPDNPPIPEERLVSGASSPSREVQQIMAHTLPYTLPLEEDTNQTPVPEEPPITNGGAETYAEDDIYVTPEKPKSLASSETNWPQISLAQINSANQRKASSDKSSSHSLNNSLNVSTVEHAPGDEIRRGLSPADKSRLEALETKLDKLCDLVMQQSRELRSLRGEITSPREMVDEALHAHSQRTQQAVESALSDGWERIARVGEVASSRAAQAAGVGAARALEPLAQALKNELAAKLTATDHLLRDNIEKLANSKTVMERLSTSIARAVADMVRDSFRSALTDSAAPLMEKAHAQLFRQINQAFQNGTKEFVANTEVAARAAVERGSAATVAQLKAALERHELALGSSAPPAALMQTTLTDVAHHVLEKELSWWRGEARAAVAAAASRAHSPSTPHSHTVHLDRQMQVAQIQSLVSGGDVNGAFQLALSASDLTLVVCACRSADPATVFGPPCKLKQHVLLSLVQQLAADMTRDTQLKHRYLEEAVMNLDTSSQVTREHLPAVVRELQKQLVAFLNTQPHHALARQFKMLLMATESLVKATV